MSGKADIAIWLDQDAFRLYVKLRDRMDNREFHERFLAPLKVLGFRFDASRVAHFIELYGPEECGLLMRQLDANFRVSPLERQEIMYWLGLGEPLKQNRHGERLLSHGGTVPCFTQQ